MNTAGKLTQAPGALDEPERRVRARRVARPYFDDDMMRIVDDAFGRAEA
jgi:hypothetical protein